MSPCPTCGNETAEPVNPTGIVNRAYATMYDAQMVIMALEAGAELDGYDMRKLLRGMDELRAALKPKRKAA